MTTPVNAQSSGSGTSISSGALMASTSAPVAPIIEPPKEFGHVAPGIYRCSASSLVKGLSPAPKKWRTTQQHPKLVQLDSSKTITTIHGPNAGSNSSFLEGDQTDLNSLSPWAASSHNQNGTKNNNGNSSNPNTTANTASKHTSTSSPLNATPTEAFLSSLQLRMILLMAPEKMPSALAAWCALHNVKLVHLGLGALADSVTTVSIQDSHRASNAIDEISTTSNFGKSDPFTADGTNHGLYANSAADMMSLERIAKDSLELILNKKNLPCLVCDMSGVNETGIVVGCLRRLQRFNFASIRLEYRNFAGSRARSSHERFIEMFDTDMIDLPPQEQLPFWLVDQFIEDENEENQFFAP